MIYREQITNKIESELFFAALELDLFSSLDIPKTSLELSSNLGYNQRNLDLCLNGLVSTGYLIKTENKYSNTTKSEQYLSRNSETYIGDLLLYKRKMYSIENLTQQIKQGSSNQTKSLPYDFKILAEYTCREMRLFRLEYFLSFTTQLLKDHPNPKILDLGGGPGIMAIDFVKQHPRSTGVVFEKTEVAKITKEFVLQNKVEKSVQVYSGDFQTDELGSDYDLILASGVLAFAGNKLESLVERIYNSLNIGGYLIVVTPHLQDNETEPKEVVLSWLSGRLSGLDPILMENVIYDALEKKKFNYIREYKEPLYHGRLYQK